MKRAVSACVFALGLCACVQAGDVGAPQTERISFSVEPCFGFCPDFSLSVDADGRGTYEGENFVAARGSHSFSASPAEFAAFRDRLAPFRPVDNVEYGYDNCDAAVMSDMPSVNVTWHESDGSSTTLNWYMGCRQSGLSDRRDEIYRAWEELPVADLVGADKDRPTFGPS